MRSVVMRLIPRSWTSGWLPQSPTGQANCFELQWEDLASFYYLHSRYWLEVTADNVIQVFPSIAVILYVNSSAGCVRVMLLMLLMHRYSRVTRVLKGCSFFVSVTPIWWFNDLTYKSILLHPSISKDTPSSQPVEVTARTRNYSTSADCYEAIKSVD